jgi:hypothetical protein
VFDGFVGAAGVQPDFFDTKTRLRGMTIFKPGRPPSQNPLARFTVVRMTAEMHVDVANAGGSPFIRAAIVRALILRKKQNPLKDSK